MEALIGRANELAERHKLSALRPLAAAPLVLKLRDEEVALEKQVRCTVMGWVWAVAVVFVGGGGDGGGVGVVVCIG